MTNPHLQIHLPRSRFAALGWVCEFIFGEISPNVRMVPGDDAWVVVTDGMRELRLASIFPNLERDRSAWEMQNPTEPLGHLIQTGMEGFVTRIELPIPVIFGRPTIRRSDTGLVCEADLFGSIFHVLSRFEEITGNGRDQHDRFPAKMSLAYRNGFLERPIADQYRALFLDMLDYVWPGTSLPEASGRMEISCDVDEPFDRSVRSISSLAKVLGGDVFKRRNPALAARRLLNATVGARSTHFDPCYTFDWYMDQCEAAGLQVTFYFIAQRDAGAIDGTYDIDDPRILKLLRDIAARGHLIGMHGSYLSFRDPDRLRMQRFRLVDALAKAGLDQDVIENRQHYLRWDASCTPDYLDAAGFLYDTSGGFADRPGFRFGTAREFRMWSWVQRAPLALRQKPLIAMEGSLLSSSYMGLTDDEALDLLVRLRCAAEDTGGNFSLLWHNSELKTNSQRKLFSRLVA